MSNPCSVEESALFDEFFRQSLELFCICNREGRIVQVNPAFARALGYSAKKPPEGQFLDFVHPDDQETTTSQLSQWKTDKVPVSFENRWLCADGTWKWLV